MLFKIEGNLVSGLLSLTGRTIAHFVTRLDLILSQHLVPKDYILPNRLSSISLILSFDCLPVLPDCIKIGSDSASRSIKSISSAAAALALALDKQKQSVNICFFFLYLSFES